MANVLERAAAVRTDAIASTDAKKRVEYAQHLTPPETAALTVSMFSELNRDQFLIKCLDLGAGTGVLSAALYDRYDGHIEQLDAVEADPVLATIYEAEMSSIGVPHRLVLGDALTSTPDGAYDRIILNPPYKKMAAKDVRQSGLPCKSANLYSAFIAIGLSRLAKNGELVAIVPRSWMNGDYFEPFRRYALGYFSLDAIHTYGSRKDVFKDTKVLQETMIVRFSNRRQCETIRVSQSNGISDEISVDEYPANKLIDPFDFTVRIAPESDAAVTDTISSLGLCPSTGKVVDFRCRDITFGEKPDDLSCYPLLYAGNFSSGKLEHPRDIGKPQWYVANDKKAYTQLTQPGSYVVVKRFSAKEERKRVVAYPLTIDEPVALENHLNFIHAGTPRNVIPLESKELAQGLALWLNSTFVDEWFRDVSGSTQVNARDIKCMPCLPLGDLKSLGDAWSSDISQAQIDQLFEEYV